MTLYLNSKPRSMKLKIINLLIVMFLGAITFGNNKDFHYDQKYVERTFEKLDLIELEHNNNPDITLESILSTHGLEHENIQPISLREYASKSSNPEKIFLGVLIGVGGCLLIIGIWMLLILYS